MRILNLKNPEQTKNKLSLLLTGVLGIAILYTLSSYYGTGLGNMLGVIILAGSIFLLSILFFRAFHSEFFKSAKQMILVETIVLLMLIGIILIEQNSDIPGYFVPTGAAGILLTILTTSSTAGLSIFIISLLAGIIGDFSLGYFYVSVAGGLAGVYSSVNVRNRRDLNGTGLYILLATTIAIAAIDMMSGRGIVEISKNIGWGAGNALISVIIASGLLPIFESAFGITTNIKLLELGDFNHPLLKRLMLEAPGTYHHSIMVANLTENACEKIGANSLLGRVGAYYHDIGKLKNPQYFIENQMQVADKHKKLKPNISALILKRHVKDGLAMADEYNLDQVIKDMIIQHHGSTLIEYFYKKNIEESKKGEEVIDKKEYRYPGPRPLSKEAGVLMLADAVEAACRTLEEPTYSRIAGLVTKVVNNKFIDNQLNNCDITLANLEQIQKSFVNTLAGIYHSRIEYPEDKEETE